MKHMTLLIFIILICFKTHAQPLSNSFFEEADAFFSTYVRKGLVDYRAIKKDSAPLQALVKQIGDISLTNTNRKARKAFYINTYNILTIHAIIANGIPDSPMDVEGFFDRITHRVAGRPMTLDNIEKDILLPEYKDARLHFVLVCAAMGCPAISPYAYTPGPLDRQMDQATVRSLNDKLFIRVKPAEKRVLISEIFKWYKTDFLAEADSLRDYINRYRKNNLSPGMTIDYYTYDWSLNMAK